MHSATTCAVKGAHVVAGDKLCRGDKMCRNMMQYITRRSDEQFALIQNVVFVVLVMAEVG